MVSERLDLCLRTYVFELIERNGTNRVDRSSGFQEFFSGNGPDARKFFENIFLHGFRASLTIRRDREPMGLIACFLQYHEFSRSLFEENGIFFFWEKNLLFSLRDRTNRWEWYCIFG